MDTWRLGGHLEIKWILGGACASTTSISFTHSIATCVHQLHMTVKYRVCCQHPGERPPLGTMISRAQH